MSAAEIMPGAEPLSVAGDRRGALVLHGFTGNPQSMRGLAEAFAAAGFTVEMPLLPGHGTSLDDMLATRFDDWYAAADAVYADLAARTDSVVVTGLSMGGTLAITLAADHSEIVGLVLVNPLVEVTDPGMLDFLTAVLDSGSEVMDAIGCDIADPDAAENAYKGTPIRPLQSLMEHARTLPERLGAITCPILLCSSAQDHVVDPQSSETLAAKAGGSVERVTLERSYHVATLDYDKDLIEAKAVEFADRVSG